MVGVLTSLLLPGGGAGAARVPFHVSAARVEQALIPKLSLLEAQGPGVSAEEHLAELRRHISTTRSAVAGGSGVGGAGPSAGSSAAAAAFETESLSSDFIALRQLADNMQTDSREDRIAVLDAALQSSLHLPRRVLTNGDKEAALCRRDSTLAVILSLHPFLHEYFTLAVVMEPSGEIPPGLEDWSITGFAGRDPTFLQSFLAGDWAEMDWYGSSTRSGLCYYLSRYNTAIYEPPKPADWFCVPVSLKRLADFGQRLFSALGYPSAVSTGYTFQTFIDLIVFYLEKAPDLPTETIRYQWVADCATCAREGLALAARAHKLRIGLAGGAVQAPLEALLPAGCEPVRLLQTRSAKMKKTLEEERRRPQSLLVGTRATVRLSAANQVPLLSERPTRSKRLRAGDDDDTQCPPAPDPEEPGGRPLLLHGSEPLALHAGAEPPPGVRGALVRGPTAGKTTVQIGGLVWNINALSPSKGERPEGKCVGVILSQQTDDKRKSLCLRGMQGLRHATLSSPAHTLKNFAIAEDAKTFARPATPEEQAEYDAKYPRPVPAKKKSPGFRQPAAQ